MVNSSFSAALMPKMKFAKLQKFHFLVLSLEKFLEEMVRNLLQHVVDVEVMKKNVSMISSQTDFGELPS